MATLIMLGQHSNWVLSLVMVPRDKSCGSAFIICVVLVVDRHLP